MNADLSNDFKQIACPTGTTLDGSLCYAPCPMGFTRFLDDVNVCQQDKQDMGTFASYCESVGLTQDTSDDLLCLKNNQPTGTSPPCVAPEYPQGSQCWERCPASLTDNTSTCLKRLYLRVGLVPICGGSQIWNGSQCVSTGGSSSSGGGAWPTWFLIATIALLAALTLGLVGPTLAYGLLFA